MKRLKYSHFACHNASLNFITSFFTMMRKLILCLLLTCFIERAASCEIFKESSSDSYKKTVLITGGAGFIGSNFLKYMFDKYPDYRFIVLDKLTYAGSLDNIPLAIQESDRFQFIHGSVADEKLVDRLLGLSQFAIHFAAESHVTRSLLDDAVFFDTNVMGTRTLMAGLVKHMNTVERFVHISSSEVYGTAEYEPMDENHLLKPRSPYAATKAAADRIVYAYSCSFDIPSVIFRPFNNYGPFQHLEKMIPHFIVSAIEKKPLTIHGDGHQGRDWMYTTDLSIAIDLALHHPDFSKLKNQEINLGSGTSTSVIEIAQMILDAFDLPQTYLEFVKDRSGQVENQIACLDKAWELLGWAPTIGIEQGLRETVEWYVRNPSFCEKRKDEAVVSEYDKNK